MNGVGRPGGGECDSDARWPATRTGQDLERSAYPGLPEPRLRGRRQAEEARIGTQLLEHVVSRVAPAWNPADHERRRGTRVHGQQGRSRSKLTGEKAGMENLHAHAIGVPPENLDGFHVTAITASYTGVGAGAEAEGNAARGQPREAGRSSQRGSRRQVRPEEGRTRRQPESRVVSRSGAGRRRRAPRPRAAGTSRQRGSRRQVRQEEECTRRGPESRAGSL